MHSSICSTLTRIACEHFKPAETLERALRRRWSARVRSTRAQLYRKRRDVLVEDWGRLTAFPTA